METRSEGGLKFIVEDGSRAGSENRKYFQFFFWLFK